jgi:branched-chain amino acid transport system substrate-binding protein
MAIGLINPEAGPLPAGQDKTVVEAARRLINEKLGGIGGHPLLIKACATGASDEHQGHRHLHGRV